jgi:Myb-like DNA-binding domain
MSRHGKLPTPNRSSGNKRWSPEDDRLLLKLVEHQQDWIDIAQSMSRSFISVQHRFRFLRATSPDASSVKAKISSRALDPMEVPDLTCGAPSKAARRLLHFIRKEISDRERAGNEPIDETDLIVGALIRELLTLRARNVSGWLRVTVSLVSSPEHGVGKMQFSRLLNDLELRGLIERTVGVPGALVLRDSAARQGRFVLIRATLRLKLLCSRRGIGVVNLLTHLPTLAGMI